MTCSPFYATLTYGYDNIYQLKTAKQGTTTKESYTYDLVGNRLSSLGVSPYNYNSSNELTSTPSGSYTYDSNGNRKTDPTGAQYTWDLDNRLKQEVLPGTGGTVNFKYDPFGRRVQKAFTQGSTTNYLYSGANLLEELDNSGNVLARYTEGPNVDEPLSELRSGTTSYYEQDGLGSVTSLSNSAGALANTYTYDSFGRLTASTGTLANPFQYTGREFDVETGLFYYRARYFDQNAGRFLNEDPVRFGAGTNFYTYVGNSSLNFRDPSGQFPGAAPGLAPEPIAGAGPLLVLALDAWLAQHDWQEFQKLCAAYGWAWCSPTPPLPDWWNDLVKSPDFDPYKKPGRCKNQSGCQPCIPPVGTIAYRLDSGPSVAHWPFSGPHWHLFEMHQSPAPSCQCRWVELGVGQGPTPPVAQPIGSADGGGSQ